MDKLFTGLELSNYKTRDILKSFREDLKPPKVYLTFRYTRKRKIVFYFLSVKVDGKTKDLLGKEAIKDSDGNQTFLIGQYKKGQELEISFGVLPIVKVPKAIALIGQTNPQKAYQVDPSTPGKTNTLERGVNWEKSIKYKVQ